jgi:hypothetical protein
LPRSRPGTRSASEDAAAGKTASGWRHTRL